MAGLLVAGEGSGGVRAQVTMLLTKEIRYWFKCATGHRFVRAKRDAFPLGCPKCGMPVKLYGLSDSTRYSGEHYEEGE